MGDPQPAEENPQNVRVMTKDETFSIFIMPLNVATIKSLASESAGVGGTKSLYFSLDNYGRFLDFDPNSEQSLTILFKDGEVSTVHFTDRGNTQEDNVLYEHEANALRSIHSFSKIDWAALKIYRDSVKGNDRFVNFLSRLRDTQDATRKIGMEAGIAFSKVGILDTVRQDGIVDFADGKTGIAFITSAGDLRNSVIRDCTNSELKKDDEKVLSEVKERAFKSDHKSAVVYYNRKKGTFRSFVKEDPMGEYQTIELTFRDRGDLAKLSFHNSKQPDAEFELKTGEHAMGFTKHELKALSLVALFNAKVNIANHEFTVAYSKSDQTEDAPMVSELKLAVPGYFERKSQRFI